jgi:hypothetical protein
MPHFGTLREHRFAGDVDDIRGATVYGLEDEKLGKLDDVIFDHSTGQIRYAVVDSGGWLRSHKFLVPADRIFPHEQHDDAFVIGVTKQQIESFPPYDESKLESEENWKAYEKEYERGWHESPVQHHYGTDRNITPAEEVRAEGGSRPLADRDLTPAELYPERLSDKFTSATPGGQRTTMEPRPSKRVEEAAFGTAPLSSRWSAFEEHLRRNRVDIQAKCPQCSPALEKKRDVA